MLDVDLSRNMIGFGGETERVPGQVAELAHILNERFKKNSVATHNHIRAQLWGIGGPTNEGTAVKVLIHRLRKICSKWNFRIEGYRGLGYELVPPGGTPHCQPK